MKKLDYTVFNVIQDRDGFINYTYRDKDNPNELKKNVDKKFVPYFYVPLSQKKNLENLNLVQDKVKRTCSCDTKTLVTNEETIKIITNKSIDVRDVRDIFGEHYEADIIFTRRWMIDNFFDKEFASIQPRVHFLDIEVGKPKEGYPKWENPNEPVTALTLYDNYDKKYYTFSFREGTRKIDKKKGMFIYPTEREMLRMYLEWYKIRMPDILTGWNVIHFDLNYLYHRLIKVFNKIVVDKILSPFKYVGQRKVRGRFGNIEDVVDIKGVLLADYLEMYRKNNQQMRENYKLDYIAEIELEKRKVEFEGGIDELYKNNFTTFLKYNRMDCRIVKELDDKFKYIDLIDYIRRYSRTLLSDHDYTSAIIDGYLLCEAKHKNVALPSAKKDQHGEFEGAYVHAPKVGISRWICSYDLNALYPNIIKTINISPETKLGKKGEFDFKGKYAIAGNDVCFSKETIGFIPSAITKLVDVRTKTKAKAQELKREGKDFEAEPLDKLQKALKVIANGTYGYLSFNSSRFFDLDMAGAITGTGSKLIQFLIKHVTEYLRKTYGLPKADFIVGGDTDSCYVTLEPITEKLKTWDDRNEKQKLKIIDRISFDIQDVINNKFVNVFAKEVCNTDSHFFGIKREIVGKSGYFIAKKRYVIWIINDEGKKVNKLKKVGLEIVRSNISRMVKGYLEDIIWDVLKSKTNSDVNKKVKKLLDDLRSAPVEEIALPIGLSKPIKEYNKKGIPMHVRGAMWFNEFIAKKQGIEDIRAGDRILYLPILEERSRNYLGTRTHVIAFIDKCPVEKEKIEKILDWERIEKRNVYGPLEPIYEGLKWVLPGKSTKTSLMDF